MNKIVLISTSFPSIEYPYHGVFNLKAANAIKKHHEIIVIHLRSNNLKRAVSKKRIYEGIEILELSIPYFSSFNNVFTALNIGFYKRLAFYKMKKVLNQYTIIHSVGGVLTGQVGSYISKKTGLKHINQVIGSDVNFILPELKELFGVKGWENHVDIIGCNSKDLENKINKMYPNVRTKVIYRGVNVDKIPFSESKTSNSIKFLYLGGLSNIKSKTFLNKHPIKSFNQLGEDLKGGVLLLKVWKAWILENSIKNAELFFGGPNVTLVRIENIIGNKITDLKIRFVGALDHKEVLNIMKASNVIVVPSYGEGMPNIAMESFSSGRPVIGSNIGGIPEIISHKIDGYLFDSGDMISLTEALGYFYNNIDNLQIFEKKARKKVEDYFDSKEFIINYNDLYYNET